MVSLIKQLLRGMLRNLGYVVLKQENYANLVSAIPPTGKPARELEALNPAPSWEQEWLRRDSEFKRFHDQLDDCLNQSPDRAHALFSLVRDLKAANVEGDFVDCGNGSPDALAIIGAALAFHEDSGRKLVLLDISGDPTHRTESELRLWGGESELFASSEKVGQLKKLEAQSIPVALRLSGYPLSRILVLRAPVGAISRTEFPTRIAFLKVTGERYSANRTAVTQLLLRVVEGGIVVVEGAIAGRGQPNLIAELSIDQEIPLTFTPLTESFHVARR